MVILTFYRLLLIGALASVAPAAAQRPLDLGTTTYYPRVIRLEHAGPATGNLLASLDSGPSGIFYESRDQGHTWQKAGTVTDKTPPRTCCSGLYEVPRDLPGTPAGTLFWSTSVGTDQGGRGPCSIRLYRSADQGRTWTYFSTPVSGYIGLWEPEFNLDSRGRLVVYYSSEESKARGYNQLLAHKISADGGQTWGPEVVDVGKPDGLLRPGMATVRRLPNGQYVMAYEVCGQGCDVYIRASPNGTEWGDAATMGTRVESTEGHHFAHAPTLAWSPSAGAPDGQLLVIGQLLFNNTDNQQASQSGQVFMVNRRNGQGAWQEVPAPVPVPDAKGHPCPNYTSQLLPAADGTTVLEVALRLTPDGCRAFYNSAPMPATAQLKPK